MTDRFDLTGKVTVVTGGHQGNLGPLWCKILARQGAKVVPLGLPTIDLQCQESLAYVKNNISKIHGRVDILIHNAAIDNPPGSRASFFGNFEHIMAVNWGVAVNVTQKLLPLMRNGGNVTVIGSMLGFIAADPRNYPEGFDKPCAYGSSKAALWNFVKNCAVRYAKQGIVFNMLALSGVEGKQDDEFKKKYCVKIPTGRMLQQNDFETEFLTCVTAKVPYDEPLFVGGGWTLW